MICDLIQTTDHYLYKITSLKHLQTQHIKIIKCTAVEGVLYQSFNTFFKESLMVTIHGRGKSLVWIVVNTAIKVIELFYNKDEAAALYGIVRHYEKLVDGERATETFLVERSVDKLAGRFKGNYNEK